MTMKLKKIYALCASLALLGAYGCSDDDAVKTPLATATGEAGNVSCYSLSFSWDKVKDAIQYGYQLTDPNEREIATGVTNFTSASFTSLRPSTTYKLTVWAYADIAGKFTTSEPLVLTATTKDVIKLATPVLEVTEQGSSYYVTWAPVEGAQSYSYSFTNGDETLESGSVTSPSLVFSDLANGTYIVTVKAVTTVEGYESSNNASCSFTVDKSEIWRVTGTYNSAVVEESWDAVLVAYSNGTYSIKAWYNAEGYDFNFSYDSSDADTPFVPSSSYNYNSSTYCYEVPTGRDVIGDIPVYPWYHYCDMTGDSSKGSISMCVWSDFHDDYVYDTFEWGNAPADYLTGTWNISIAGKTAITDDWTWEDFTYDYTIDLTRVDAKTIKMEALYFADDFVEGTVDLENRTVTFQPTPVWTYYILAGSTGPEEPIVGHISEDGNTITIDNWYGWYVNPDTGKATSYVKNTTAILTR